ncbi:MAG: Spy/CpxP family protein refolding chaperone [Hyphomicrobiales bacterium]|nr:Spy/CpxP family protein refolding chaperone [Hyphomicrobiales bacterium]
MRAFQAARLAALRAGLTLSAEQEKHWPAFERAMQELQQLRLKRFTAAREGRRAPPAQEAATDPAQRMRDRAARLSESGALLKRLADATEPLYRSLDEAQKRRFAILTRAQGARGEWQRRGRDGTNPRGPRRTELTPDNPDFAAPGAAGPDFGHTRSRAGTGLSGIVGDGVVRAFGIKSVAGDLAIAELAPTSGARAFSGKLDAGPVSFAGKAIDGALPFGRKIPIGEPAVFRGEIRGKISI